MKKLLIFAVIILLSTFAYSQVGIGTVNPHVSSILDVKSTTKGLLPPRMTEVQMGEIEEPAAGLIVYCTDCNPANLYVFDGTTWKPIGADAVPGVVANCATATFNGTYTAGTTVSGATFTVTITNNTFSQAVINFSAADLVLQSGTGLTVGTPTGAPALTGGNATLGAGGSVTVTYPLTGTLPASCGSFTATWTKLSLSCEKTLFISPANFALPTTAITIAGGNITDFTANWTAQAGATGYTLEYSTSQNGPWTAFPSNPYTGTSATITGLTSGSVLYSKVTLVGSACDGASAIQPVGCSVKINATDYKTFACHNLGADTNLDPNVPVQGIHGNYYQWGRSAVVADATTPAGTISGWNTTPAANGAWQDGTITTNDPCPTGFRVPTQAQWNGVLANNSVSRTSNNGWASGSANFGSAIHFGPDASTKTLTLPAAGYRFSTNGTLGDRGSLGTYWSSTELNTNAWYLFFDSSEANPNGINRTNGFSVRCVSE